MDFVQEGRAALQDHWRQRCGHLDVSHDAAVPYGESSANADGLHGDIAQPTTSSS